MIAKLTYSLYQLRLYEGDFVNSYTAIFMFLILGSNNCQGDIGVFGYHGNDYIFVIANTFYIVVL